MRSGGLRESYGPDGYRSRNTSGVPLPFGIITNRLSYSFGAIVISRGYPRAFSKRETLREMDKSKRGREPFLLPQPVQPAFFWVCRASEG